MPAIPSHLDPDPAPLRVPFPTRQQLALHHELHARPPVAARPPCVVSYWAQEGMLAEQAEAALAQLCLANGQDAPPSGARHFLLQAPRFALKYERHGEFVSWQMNQPLASPPPDGDNDALGALLEHASALSALPDAFVSALSGNGAGQMLAAAHVLMLDGRADDSLPNRCRALMADRPEAAKGSNEGTLMGAWVGDGHRSVMFTQLRLGLDGFTRYLLLDLGMSPGHAARQAQRLCEIEAYRMLAMLGFPVAQKEAGLLANLERQLQTTVDAMANDQSHDDIAAFEALTKLAAEVEHCTARTRYRFSATRAYHRLVERRLTDLREQRLPGVQTLGGFLARRFTPAMAFCESTDARLTDIAERINRATGLARVRIEVRREEGNQTLLQALATRQHQQLLLQQTVEGLSVVAISYYALGLVGYLAKAAKGLPMLASWSMSPDLVVGLAVLPVVLAVTLFVRNLRLRLH